MGEEEDRRKESLAANNVSTFGSQSLDTTIFCTIAFYGIIPNDVLPKLIIGSYLMKLLVAVIDTPIVYLVVYWVTGHWTSKGDIVEEETDDVGNDPGATS